MDNEQEILRLRNWRHDEVDPVLRSLVLRVERLEVDVRDLTPIVEDLREQGRISAALKVRLREDNTLRFTRWQRAGAFLLTAATVVGTISNWWHL